MNFGNTDELSRDEFIILLDRLRHNYYNNTIDPNDTNNHTREKGENNKNEQNNEIISDETYDYLKDFFEKKFGEQYNKVGASATGEKRVLPKYMGSLDKITDEKSLKNWKNKYEGPYLIMDKIDGVSVLQLRNNLFTRGDGNVGTDISHLSKNLNIPSTSRENMIRMEIVMPKKIFEIKYSTLMANSRNMVSGIVNRKNPSTREVNDLILPAYEFDDGKNELKPSEQLHVLKSLGYLVPWHEKLEDISISCLTETLLKRKDDASYDIDGIVVYQDKGYRPVVGENPRHAFAFKMEGECVSSIVREVQWNISKNGLLKPRVRIDPIQLCGVTITWCTGFNGKFILDNKISSGCVVEVTRRGDVIPYIKDVVHPGKIADMPTEYEYEWVKKKNMVLEQDIRQEDKSRDDLTVENYGEDRYYVWWTTSDVDIAIKSENDESRIQKLVSFFKKMEAKFVGESSIRKLYENGYTTLKEIFNLTLSDVNEIKGFGEKGGKRLIESIRCSITNVCLAKVSHASGEMGAGIGEKRIKLVFDKYPHILDTNLSLSEKTSLVETVQGFNTMAVHFCSRLKNLKEFLTFHHEISLVNRDNVGKNKCIIHDDENENEDENNTLSNRRKELKGKTVVFTGFRNKQAEDVISESGGKVSSSVSGKTSLLVVAKRYSSNSKEIKADQLGIEVITGEEFHDRYMKI